MAKRVRQVCSYHDDLTDATQAVGALYKNFYEPSFDKLLKRLAGMIFMGVPHPTFDKQHEWQKMSSLLRASTKLGRKETDRHAQHVHAVARVSQLFNDSNVELPILSMCETKTTKINSTFLSSRRETVGHTFLCRSNPVLIFQISLLIGLLHGLALRMNISLRQVRVTSIYVLLPLVTRHQDV